MHRVQKGAKMMRKLFVSGIALQLLTACAAYQGSASALPPQRTVAVEATCTNVMGLTKGEAEFAGCVSSLSSAVAEQLQAAVTNRAYRACEESGLQRETPEFSRCVLNRENSRLASDVPQVNPVSRIDADYAKPADGDSESYFRMTFNQRHRREQYSCAGLGLDPGTGSFVSCVDNLDTTLFGIDRPNT